MSFFTHNAPSKLLTAKAKTVALKSATIRKTANAKKPYSVDIRHGKYTVHIGSYVREGDALQAAEKAGIVVYGNPNPQGYDVTLMAQHIDRQLKNKLNSPSFSQLKEQ